MKIALRSMGTSKFLKKKKVNTKNINNGFGGKMYLIVRNRLTAENKFYTGYIF